MSEPKRIQRRRTKGWRMPEGAVYVGRPTRYGNQFEAVETMSGWTVGGPYGFFTDRWATKREAAAAAVESFRNTLLQFYNAENRNALRRELAGLDLCCWCPLDQPCHADVLLEIANREQP